MFTFKPKKVFDKLNKMDRKQAYTIGAIAVVSIVALLMLISAATGTQDDSFDGMTARGYDLASMPFATDEAEKYLLVAKYPDMKENGSTLLYSAEEKQARQEEDAQAEEASGLTDEMVVDYDDNTSAPRSDNGGYGGYSGGYGSGRAGSGSKTEIGQLSPTGMATSGGSGVNSTWGPTGDFRQFKGREGRGNETPQQLVIDRNKEAAAFRTASMQAARAKGNQITAQRKAVQQLSVTGENPTTTGPTIDPAGGFQIEDGALPSTTDLDNLDKRVAEAAKKAEEKKKEERKLSFWEQLAQDLLRQAASSLVNSVMDGIGDTMKGAINGQRAYYNARRNASNDVYAYVSGAEKYNPDNPYGLTQEQFNTYRGAVTGDNKLKPGAFYRKYGKKDSYASSQGSSARLEVSSGYYGSTHNTQIGQANVATQQSTTTATR